MEMPPRVQPVLDEPRVVDIWAIERALVDLARDVARTSEAEHVALTRAASLTLVAYVPLAELAAQLTDVIARTSERHPSRAIVIVNDPDQREMRASIAAYCNLFGRDRRQICSEQVSIHAQPEAHSRIPSIVRHLALSDMPVVLYWRGPVTWDGLFVDLLDVMDRVVLDSSIFPEAARGLSDAARFVARSPGVTGLSDLNWGRLTTWRSLTAHFFDIHGETLDQIDRVRIGHDGTSRAQALLYAGWLTARLGWNVEEPFVRGPGPWRAALRDAHRRPITVSLHADHEFAVGGGSLVLTMLVARGGDAAFSIGRKDDRNTIMAISESESGLITRRVLPLDVPDEAALLSDELDVLGRDNVYEGTLQAVAALVGEA